MVGCHLTKEEVVKVQKGLRFRFLESHNLELDKKTHFLYASFFVHLNSFDVMELEYLVSSQSARQ